MSSWPEPPAIDLNADLGEGADDAPLFAAITSANIACGGHAGTIETMRAALALCASARAAAGAHPGYEDREGFGRKSPRDRIPADRLEALVHAQIETLSRVARAAGVALVHVKPHGALYHDASADPEVARAIASAARRVDPGLVLVGQAGRPALATWAAIGCRTAAEGFADRGYAPDGGLLPRGAPGALLDAPSAAAQALHLARSGRVATLCIHADTPGAAAIALAVRDALRDGGFEVRSLARGPARP